MQSAYIIDAVRTPIGKYGGSLSSLRPDDLAALVMKAIVSRNNSINNDEIEDVIFGAANQAGEDNRNVARMALLLAGLPPKVGGVTVNRLCASSLQAIMDASRAIMLGEGEIYIAGGVESMSRAPYVMAKPKIAFDRNPQVYDTTIGWRFINPQLSELYHPYSMGETAENIAKEWNISREEQDQFSLDSQKKYQQALKTEKFKEEIVPVTITQERSETIIDADEHPRMSTIEKISSLKPAFIKEGTVTAANSSGINDGASALLLMSENACKKFEVKPMVKIKSMAIAGVNPDCMGVGPVPATKKAIIRAGLDMKDIGLVELNEAFAAQSIACIQDLDINPEIVNVNGGAIALGHPLGASGARISTTLIHEMMKRPEVKYGLATMCVGVGQGAAVIYEKCE